MMTAAATLWSPNMAFSASHRFQSLASLVRLRLFLGLTCRTTASKSLAPATKRCSTIRMVSRFPNGKYIREDYLVKKVSAKEVQELVKGERTVPLVVDFYATWCGPCILMAQELETLAVEYEGNALFVKVDTDDEYEFARDMQVRGLPTLYFISPDPNKDAIRTEGLVPPEMIKNIIDNEILLISLLEDHLYHGIKAWLIHCGLCWDHLLADCSKLVGGSSACNREHLHATLQNTTLASFPAPRHHALVIPKKSKPKSKAAGSIARTNKGGQENYTQDSVTIHNKVSESFIEGKENKKNKKQQQRQKEDNATTRFLTSLELPQPVLEEPIRSLVPAAVVEVLGVAVGVVTETQLLGPVHAPAFLQQSLEEVAPAAAPLEADGAAEEVEPRVAALQREPRRGSHAAN
ncbi:Thioredoxin [Musa troglodytarum]|uniref:Thioredoxin-like protein CITRX, chloroplastic n=1 Tax=Musa troglodytarum TaxID=320322 RepID=A0A9E7HUM5_9LILI|nr:Thioredoxin [Musa troglodytarum]